MSRRPTRAIAFTALIGPFLALGLSHPAAALECPDVEPFINEFDYDSNDGFPNFDDDEFVEIAAPAGTDLGGVRVLAIEGNEGGLFGLPCSTGFGVSKGNAHFDVAIPGGTIVPDQGGNMGVVVVCFTGTSENIAASGRCTVTLPTPFNDSSLKNGHLTNGNQWECPDGILLLDGQGGLLDAVSYEGVVPAVGTYGALFNAPNPSYQAPLDAGFSVGESLLKTTGNPERATSAGEWQLSGENMASPAFPNPGQGLACELPPPDSDGDTVPDPDDNCVDDPNPGQEDADEDGVGDVCDNCVSDANPGQGDADLDGVGNACDNCPDDPNPGQEDGDMDGIGDVCDLGEPVQVPALPLWAVPLLVGAFAGAVRVAARRRDAR